MLLTSPLHLIVLRYFFSIFAFLCWTAFVARGFQAPLYSPTKGGWELWNSGFTAVETAPRTATLVLAKKARRDEWRMEIENERGTRRRRHFKENGEPRLLPFLAHKALNKPPAFTYSSWSFLSLWLPGFRPARRAFTSLSSKRRKTTLSSSHRSSTPTHRRTRFCNGGLIGRYLKHADCICSLSFYIPEKQQ